jgi:hypothetical protein
MLDVYDWPAPDGLRGGSAHVHLASTEGYVVIAGQGRLQTLSQRGYAEAPLRPGDCLWFTPGTVHRLVNDDGKLQILVVMQNSGLPEDGDCVLTFPAEVLADASAYAAAATLRPDAGEAAARRRRDLAIDGFTALRAEVARDGPAAFEVFLAAAVRLVAARVPRWRVRWQSQAAAVAALTGTHLDDIEAIRPAHLLAGSLLRIPAPAGPRRYGMCGWLTVYTEAAEVLPQAPRRTA